VTIPPAPSTLLKGHAATTLAYLRDPKNAWVPHLIRPDRKPNAWTQWNPEVEYGFAPVKAFWFGEEDRDQPVMLHFHGGGYLCGTAAETDLTSSIPKALIKHSPIHQILSVDYRLAPTAPWPLPLLDAISAWHSLGTHRDIIIVGDSAGGHLALALTRYLRDEGLPLPRGLVVLSPWVDIGFTNQWGEEEIKFNADSDTIDDTFGPFATSLLLRALPPDAMHTSPYLSPASLLIPSVASGPNSFERFPPTFVVYGEAERLAKEIRLFWTRLRLAREDSDLLIMGPDSVHDFMIFPWFSVEAAAVYQKLDDWLRGLLADSNYPASPVMAPTRRGMTRMLSDFHAESLR
jgi:acetyl esterase/lipase